MSVHFEGAVVKEQGQTFGVLVVKPSILNDTARQAEMRAFGIKAWGHMPIVLMAQDSGGVPTYLGRKDIVRFLAGLDLRQLPLRRWTL